MSLTLSQMQSLDDIAAETRVAIYGTGKAGRRVQQLLQAERPDVGILCFIDSFHAGEMTGIPVVRPQEIGLAIEKPDLILVASTSQEAIAENLTSLGLSHFSLVSDGFYNQLRNISTEYINWLYFVNSGMMDRGNLYCFDFAIRNLPSEAPIVEIGSFCGLSTNLITYFKERHGRKNRFFTADKWEFEGAQQGALGNSSTVTHEEYRKFAKDSFIRNVKMFSRYDLPYTIESLSDKFFLAWQQEQSRVDLWEREVSLGGPISFCFIDGNHSYDFAKRDFLNADQFLEKGGFLLFDDSADDSGWEVCQVIEEVKALKRYEVIIQNPNYLFRKRN